MRIKKPKGQVYRHYNDDGDLLYVGMSSAFMQRQRSHRKSDWFAEIAIITVEHYATRGDAIAAEAKAILCENPRYNVRRPDGAIERIENLARRAAPVIASPMPFQELIKKVEEFYEDELASAELDKIDW